VIAFCSRQRRAANDLVSRRIDLDKLRTRLHVGEDVFRRGIVLRIADFAAERNRRDTDIAIDIDHGFGIAVLVGNIELPDFGRISHAVGIHARRYARCDLPRAIIDRDDLVRAGRRRIDSVQLRQRQHAVNLAHVRNARDDAARLRVEHDDGAVAEVRNEQQVAVGIEARVVEPRRISTQGNVRNRLQRQARSPARRSPVKSA